MIIGNEINIKVLLLQKIDIVLATYCFWIGSVSIFWIVVGGWVDSLLVSSVSAADSKTPA